MFATKQRLVLATAAALLALGGTALASDGYDGPAAVQGRAQVFAFGAPRLDTGSEAFPGTAGLGAAEAWGHATNRVAGGTVPARQRGFDTGAEAYPTAP
jgi:hypothetical protein